MPSSFQCSYFNKIKVLLNSSINWKFPTRKSLCTQSFSNNKLLEVIRCTHATKLSQCAVHWSFWFCFSCLDDCCFPVDTHLPPLMTLLVTPLLYPISMWTIFKHYMNDIIWLFVFLSLIWCTLFHGLLCCPQNDAYYFIHQKIFSLTYTNYSLYIYSLILSWFYIWSFVNIYCIFYIQMCT